MLKPFHIRDLDVNTAAERNVGSERDGQHGTIVLIAAEYDNIVSNKPDAALTYVDTEDVYHDIITVTLPKLILRDGPEAYM